MTPWIEKKKKNKGKKKGRKEARKKRLFVFKRKTVEEIKELSI